MKRFFQALSLGILIVSSAYIAPAQTDPLKMRVGADESNPLRFSMTDTIKFALENNHDIEIERVNVQQAGSDLTSARGGYDPSITFSQFFTRQLTPVTSTLGGSVTGVLNTKSYNSDFALRGLLSTGGNY